MAAKERNISIFIKEIISLKVFENWRTKKSLLNKVREKSAKKSSKKLVAKTNAVNKNIAKKISKISSCDFIFVKLTLTLTLTLNPQLVIPNLITL